MSGLGKAVSTVVVSGLLWGCHGLAEGARPAGPAPSAPAPVDAPAPASVSPAASAPAEAAPGASARAAEAPSCPEGMALIPAGSFSMGAHDLPGARRAGHEERVESFCLDIFEVGSSRHAACVESGACAKPLTGGLCTFGRAGASSRPINCVTWREAHAHCGWLGKRLPTEAEWEYAARGTDGRLFPWGNSLPGRRACWDGEGNDLGRGNRHELCPVGSYPGDTSPFGVRDMAGSVSEWTALRPDEPTPAGKSDGSTEHARRGGSWGTKQSPFQPRVTARGKGTFDTYRDGIFIGFRCAVAAR